MKLGKRAGLGHGHIVLDGDPDRPPPKGQSAPSPIFGPLSDHGACLSIIITYLLLYSVHIELNTNSNYSFSVE